MGSHWVINFDAELELAGDSLPKNATQFLQSYDLRKLPFIATGDTIAGLDKPKPGSIGKAFCPTPHALARLAREGVIAAAAPSVDVLRTVNHRAFCAKLGQTLEGAHFATDKAEVIKVIQSGSPYLLKRPLAMAGRASRSVSSETLCDQDHRWIEASLEGMMVCKSNLKWPSTSSFPSTDLSTRRVNTG
ncbi:MAG: hypothetical protein IPJ88_15730 [Myxococcales bacterium]|nr:MAG: hypothetical protein IPJ88_15730 [Myxococcales bacterium]